jgi:hypothetical protein
MNLAIHRALTSVVDVDQFLHCAESRRFSHYCSNPFASGQSGKTKEVRMTSNVGNADRIIRIIVGLVLIALVFVGPKTMWGWIGLAPLFTGLFRWCPAYRLVGINTCPKR